jgi:SAM-dependent methyltransferase
LAGERIPRRALDVACGSGRDAVYLALEGWDVEATDVLPDALGRAEDLARRSGVSIRTFVRDLECQSMLPQSRYDLVTVFRFLHRGLFPALRDAVASGGFIAYETFHERNRETGRRPCSPQHLLASGELGKAFDGWEILLARDAVEQDGRYYSSLLARKPTS